MAATLSTLTAAKVDLGETPDIRRVDSLFEAGNFDLHRIDKVNWPEQFANRPEVSFKIAHSGSEIYIKYYVTEDAVRATFDADNGRPWSDSCVEFFVSPGIEGDQAFYNIEMSCIGFGILHGRTSDRGSISMGGLDKIRRLPSMPPDAFGTREGTQSWTLTLAIPIEVFSLTPVPPLDGRRLRANFYKCGDDLPQPHYLSWSPIDTPHPSFHEPAFFGEVLFEEGGGAL